MNLSLAQTAHRVQIAHFEGPLDLLLSLVEEAKLDLTEISLTKVATQYEAYLADLQEYNVEVESSYIVVFAKLLELKSQLLLPEVVEDTADDEYESELSLLDQLKLYKSLKAATAWLEERETKSSACYSRQAPDLRPQELLLDFKLSSLTRIMVKLQKRKSREEQALVAVPEAIPLSVPERIRQFWGQLKAKVQMTFEELLPPVRERNVVVVTFLALLDLARRDKVTLTQRGKGTVDVELKDSRNND